VPIEELESKKRRRSHYGSGTGNSNNPESKVFCMIETDAFFENNQKIIQQEYLPKASQPKNTATVGQLLYEFFVFFLYEFDHNKQVISIKEPGGFSRKCQPDKLPFSIVDPFDVHKNPGRHVKLNSN